MEVRTGVCDAVGAYKQIRPHQPLSGRGDQAYLNGPVGDCARRGFRSLLGSGVSAHTVQRDAPQRATAGLLLARPMGVAAFGGFGGRGFIDDCDQRYGAVGAVADARSQTVAVVRIHQARYSARNLDDSFCTGSSIMPQKKNPDVLEILRGKAGQLNGALMDLLTMTKGIPLTYNRDLQDLNPHLWRGISNVRRDVDLLAGMMETAEFNRERMAEEAGKGGTTTTELADTLVREFDIHQLSKMNIEGE